MLGAAKRYLQEWARRKEQIIPFGFSWIFLVSVDFTMMAIGGIATIQRPLADLPVALIAMTIAFTPWMLFFFFDLVNWEGFAIGSAWTIGTAILLFGTSTPIPGDFAPLLLALTVGVVTAITSLRGGVATAAAAAAVLLVASEMHRLDTAALYLAFISIGWLVGYLVRIQQQLLTEQRQAQAQLATHVVADERRRIAREVHDVIAHSLSVTLLHLTAARHSLEHDSDDDHAVVALQHAERLGRQAMTDIRNTVGLLDDDSSTRAPEPDVTDIPSLATTFIDAGLDLTFESSGDVSRVSPAAGLALYRVAQESLANVAKHAPSSPAAVRLTVSGSAAALSVVNQLTSPPGAPGRGLRGMHQRIELLGGTIDVGQCAEGWSVRARVPVEPRDTNCPLRSPAS